METGEGTDDLGRPFWIRVFLRYLLLLVAVMVRSIPGRCSNSTPSKVTYDQSVRPKYLKQLKRPRMHPILVLSNSRARRGLTSHLLPVFESPSQSYVGHSTRTDNTSTVLSLCPYTYITKNFSGNTTLLFQQPRTNPTSLSGSDYRYRGSTRIPQGYAQQKAIARTPPI